MEAQIRLKAFALPLEPPAQSPLANVDAITRGLAGVGYIASRRIATAVFMATHLQKPVLVEGVAGVGKTELALSCARMLGLPLIRLQCYEGLDESKALYEWKYGKQLLYTQILKDHMGPALSGAPDLASAMDRLHGTGDLFFSEPFLEPRPLLKALRADGGAVLLIDEIDKSDEAFEAFLLEMLSDFQVSIPEIGVIRAAIPPVVFLTSNNVRDLGDALKRRCLHLHIPLPDQKLEERIVAARVPDIDARLTRAAGRLRPDPAHPRSAKAAVDLGNRGLGPGPDPAACQGAGRRAGARDAQRIAEVRAGRRRRGAPDRRVPRRPDSVCRLKATTAWRRCSTPWRIFSGRCGPARSAFHRRRLSMRTGRSPRWASRTGGC